MGGGISLSESHRGISLESNQFKLVAIMYSAKYLLLIDGVYVKTKPVSVPVGKILTKFQLCNKSSNIYTFHRPVTPNFLEMKREFGSAESATLCYCFSQSSVLDKLFSAIPSKSGHR